MYSLLQEQIVLVQSVWILLSVLYLTYWPNPMQKLLATFAFKVKLFFIIFLA